MRNEDRFGSPHAQIDFRIEDGVLIEELEMCEEPIEGAFALGFECGKIFHACFWLQCEEQEKPIKKWTKTMIFKVHSCNVHRLSHIVYVYGYEAEGRLINDDWSHLHITRKEI